MEKWKDIPGFEGAYQASTLGRIRSLDRQNEFKNRWGSTTYRNLKGRVLSAKTGSSGYYEVSLGAKYKDFVHRIICKTFNRIEVENSVVNHLNGNKLDNRPENLEWTTAKKNIIHSRSVLKKKGKSLTIDDVLNIIKLSHSGIMTKDIAIKYNVTRHAISGILSGQRWHEFTDVLKQLKETPPKTKSTYQSNRPLNQGSSGPKSDDRF